MDIKRLWCEDKFQGVDWINLAGDMDRQWALVNTIMKCRVPYKAVNYLVSWVTVSFSRMNLFHVAIWSGLVEIFIKRTYALM